MPGRRKVTKWRSFVQTAVLFTCAVPVVKFSKPIESAFERQISTIVTAYFQIESKHTREEYRKWIGNFLSLQDAMVIFTDSESAAWIRQNREGKGRKTLVVETNLSELYVSKLYPTSFWEHQLSLDMEKETHKGFELFQVWLNKPFFVTEAIQLNPFQSEIFAWSDIGCYREKTYNGKKWLLFPQLVGEGRLLAMAFQKIVETNRDIFTKTNHVRNGGGEWFMSGSQLVGRTTTWTRFAPIFKTTMREYERENIFVGDDQPVLQTACYRGNICEFVHPEQVSGITYFGLQQILHFGNFTPSWYTMKVYNPLVQIKHQHKCENDDFKPSEQLAIFTLLTDDDNYVDGVLKMGHAAQSHLSVPVDHVYMELATKPLPLKQRDRLRRSGWKRCIIQRIVPLDEPGTFERFRDQFSKLRAWGMTVYSTILYMDADTFPLRSIDHLLQLSLAPKKIGAAYDFGAGEWRTTFNMGVFVIHPNITEYGRLLELQRNSDIVFETAMCEQGFLNEVYKNDWEDIGFANNANLAVYSQQRKYWDNHESHLNIVHYTMNKPWECGVDYERPCSWWHKFGTGTTEQFIPARRKRN